MAISCSWLLRFNTTIEKGDGSKLSSPSSLQQHHKRNDDALLSSFFSLTQKEGNNIKLSLPFLLQHHQRRRRWLVAIVFFVAIAQ
jgi:hypothetical protein